jgi:phosphatidylglycerol:prolipoprotein diacylglycerol transferase
MHPVLFRLPLPSWTIPLFPALGGLAIVGALLAVFGWKKRAADLLLIGIAVAIGAGVAAMTYKGQVYTLTPLPIYSYGAMLCLSIVVGWYLTLGLAEKDGLPRDKMANCYFITALAALVGARLLYVATNPAEFQSFGDLFALRRGGLVAYGGFLGGFLGSWAYLHRAKIRLLAFADDAVPSLAAGVVVTRIGCYLFGCDFGTPLSDSAPSWLKKLGTFPRWSDATLEGSGSPAFIQHVNQRGLSPDAESSLPVHPTQLYEVLAGVVLLVTVILVRRRQRFRGEMFLAFTFGYGLLRFLIEIVRDDLERGEFGPYLGAHVVYPAALLMFAAAFAYGPARAIENEKVRRAIQALSLVPSLVVGYWLRPESFATSTPTQLSTSQWIGLITAVAAAVAWGTLSEAAAKHPEAAMDLGPGAVEDEEDLDEEGAAEEDEEEEPPPPPKPEKKRKNKKKGKRARSDVDEDTDPATPSSKRVPDVDDEDDSPHADDKQ